MPGVRLFTTPLESAEGKTLGKLYEVESVKAITFTINFAGSSNVALKDAANNVLIAVTDCLAKVRTTVGQWSKVDPAGTLVIKVAYGASSGGSKGGLIAGAPPGPRRKSAEVVAKKVGSSVVLGTTTKLTDVSAPIQGFKQPGKVNGKQAFAHHFSEEHALKVAEATAAIKDLTT